MPLGPLFATPCYGGLVTAAHFQSCLNLKEELTRAGLPHDWLVGTNESLVHRARMEMAAEFLRSEWSHLFWIDADIEFRPDDVASLWNLGADIACGVYAMKRRDEQWLAVWKDGALVKDLDQFDGPTEVDFAGTGFLLIGRKVLEVVYEGLRATERECRELVDKLGGGATERELFLLKRMLSGVASSYEGQNGKVPALFMTPIIESGLRSEDYFWCEMAREHGFKIMMDPSVRLGHWGLYRYGA